MRGYQKKVIFLKDTGTPLFDEAYFIVSRKGEEAKIHQSDMVFEANRIIKESLSDKELRNRGLRERGSKEFLPPFILGAFMSLTVAIAIYFLFLR